ncbi:MAG TPA: hypothetical protein VK284_11805 [Streptosporangiaceae bacterium]|nr:hypothetical protein [Streptosporangiaceae bacterium]
MAADRALVAVAKRADRQRLQDRMRELAELARLMREPGGLAEAPEPPPLYRAGRDTAPERTTS